VTSPVAALAEVLERRFGRDAERPSLWSIEPGALLSHVAVIAFGVLFVTGAFLAVLYEPSTEPVVYRGSSVLYDGQELPAAFASVIRTTEDVRGGLLVRRVHAAASHLLVAVVLLHLWRILLTGAARPPRASNQLVGVGLLLVTLGSVFTGELLPFDLVAGASLRIGHAATSSIPVVGEPLALLLFGTDAPTGLLVERVFLPHVLLLPGAFVALTGLHLWLVHRRTPTAPPGTRDPATVRGVPLWPTLVRRLLVLGCAVTAVLLVSAVLVPWSDVEFEGPFRPAEASNTLHPPWPLFFLSGGLRLMPPVDVTVAGLHVSSVFVVGVVVPGLLIGLLAAYPFLEQWRLGDRDEHHVRDGLLDVPFRVGTLGALASAFLLLSLAAAVDVIAFRTGIAVEQVIWAFRIAVVLGVPAVTVAGVALSRRRLAAAAGPDPVGHDLERHGPRRT
jgi:quinol-cytochrome oxidoreductase complex cytochrome b subunit